MLFRSFLPSDKHRLRSFRCATRNDPTHQRLVSRMLREELVPVLHDPTRDLRAFVAENDDGTLAGVIALEAIDEHRWEISAIGVSVDNRREGIATALIKFGVANSPAARAKNVFFTVHENNLEMQKLVELFRPESSPDPGSSEYVLFTAKPEAIVRGLQATLAATQHSIRNTDHALDLSIQR